MLNRMALPIAERWFERKRIGDDITLIWEPHADPLIRCNIWHLRGRDRDLLVDSGLGIASLKLAAGDLLRKDVVAVATHIHYDHVGSLHEFETRVVHRLEAKQMVDYREFASLYAGDFPQDWLESMREQGYQLPEILVEAVPEGFEIEAYGIAAAEPTRVVDEGDVIDLGDRHFEVLHLPGHSPGSIGLWEQASGTLFSGDAVYDGPLLDEFQDSDIPDYLRTMKRLRELPVGVVHAGHDPSFGRERLHQIIDAYLALRGS